uniref:Uncharacterized protein n=1 Tax=Oryza meridionalis TaxID=40149 RepID=A0A0E0EEE1_9ORYZ
MDFPETRQKKLRRYILLFSLLRIEKKLVDLGGKIVELAASMVLQSSWPNKQQQQSQRLQRTGGMEILLRVHKSKDSFLIHMRLSCCIEMFQFQSHPDTERMILAIWGLKLTSATVSEGYDKKNQKATILET